MNLTHKAQRNLKLSGWLVIFSLLASCAGTVKYDREQDLKKIEEFDEKVKIEFTEEPVEDTPAATAPTPKPVPTPTPPPTPASAPAKKAKANSATSPKVESKPRKVRVKSAEKAVAVTKPPRREPDYEDAEGFQGRRPLRDPFRVGEKVVHDVSYFGVSAGTLTIETKPFAMVNGRKSYNFRIAISTSPLFSRFYSVDDFATILVDYETLVPSIYKLQVKETGQLRETRMLFEKEEGKLFAQFWEKKYTDKHGEELKTQKWEIPDYSQNVFSAILYTRVFQWRKGKEYQFIVADDGENNMFKGKVVRREKLETSVGTFDTVVIRPEVELKGKLKPVGENLIWLTDDDRKMVLRIESKIKIGTLVSQIIQLDRGRE